MHTRTLNPQTIGSFAGNEFLTLTGDQPTLHYTLVVQKRKSRYIWSYNSIFRSFSYTGGLYHFIHRWPLSLHTQVAFITSYTGGLYHFIHRWPLSLHTQVAFITAISKRMEGSGIADIIVSAGIIADKSVDKAMRGKHFRRTVRAFQLLYEAWNRRRSNIIRRIKESTFSKDELRKSQ